MTDVDALATIAIVPKAELSDVQIHEIEQLRLVPAHAQDTGPIEVWNHYDNGTLFAAIDKESGVVIGLADASGPAHSVNAGWGVDERFRRRGYGYALVDALADYLINVGYAGVGHISIVVHREEFRAASRKLEERFRARFET